MSDQEAALRDELMMARGQVKQIAMERERFRSEVYYAQIAAQAQIEQLQKDLDDARRNALAILSAWETNASVSGEVLSRVRGYDRVVDGFKAIQRRSMEIAQKGEGDKPMIDHEAEFGWLRVGQRVHAVAEDGRCGVVLRLPSYGLGVNWGEGVTVDAMPEDVRIRAIPHDSDAEIRQAEVQAVREQLRAVTAERDQATADMQEVRDQLRTMIAEFEQIREIALDRIEAVEAKCERVQRDAVAILDAYAKGMPVPGDLMDRIKRYEHSLVIQAALANSSRMEGTVSLCARKDPA